MLSRYPVLSSPYADQHGIIAEGLDCPGGSPIFGDFPYSMIEDDSKRTCYTVQPVKEKTSPDPPLLLWAVDDETSYDDKPYGDVLDLKSAGLVLASLT
jgi:hypothetical protein